VLTLSPCCRLHEEDSFVALVRRAIQDRLTEQPPSVDVISEAIHMSPRTRNVA
jgi:hypothetical protein